MRARTPALTRPVAWLSLARARLSPRTRPPSPFATVAVAFALAWLVTACDEGDREPTLDGGRALDGHTHAHGDASSALVTDSGPDAAIPLAPVDGGFAWNLPRGFPAPPVPKDNPMSDDKVELGRHLFYDKRLSGNQTQSCATCHQQARAFADERAVGLGSTGALHTRGSMSLANVAYSPTLTWANPTQLSLERQVEVPLFGDRPVELGMKSSDELEQRLRAAPRYPELFARAFPGEPEPVTMLHIKRALAAFERTLISGNSAYDRYFLAGDEGALSESAKRGMRFVTSNEDHRFECNHCHGGFNFSDHVTYEGDVQTFTVPYHQTGLYDLDGQGTYPEPNTGAYNVTLNPSDMGKFKAPTLRNIALTAPYMHDGSIATLSEVLDHYAKGGRARNPRQTDGLLQPFTISEQEKADVIAFLASLTDEQFITNPKFSDPWSSEPTPSEPAPSEPAPTPKPQE